MHVGATTATAPSRAVVADCCLSFLSFLSFLHSYGVYQIGDV